MWNSRANYRLEELLCSTKLDNPEDQSFNVRPCTLLFAVGEYGLGALGMKMTLLP
jgi:hypothetical protein